MKLNPYQSTNGQRQNEKNYRMYRGRITTLIIAALICAVTAISVGEILALIALLPPLSNWFYMTGEFDGLILFAMPLWVGAGSIVCGVIFVILYPRQQAKLIAWGVCTAISGILTGNLLSSTQSDAARYSGLTAMGIFWFAIIAGIAVAEKSLGYIRRRRGMISLDS